MFKLNKLKQNPLTTMYNTIFRRLYRTQAAERSQDAATRRVREKRFKITHNCSIEKGFTVNVKTYVCTIPISRI